MSAPEVAQTMTLLVTHEWLAVGAMVVVERSTRSVEPDWPAGLARVRGREYGETVLWYLRSGPVAAGPEHAAETRADVEE
jgi:16S rRNA (guanine966-N2)-methyltransferase